MAYYNGTVANLSGLLAALTTACVTDGWTYAGGELTKHGCIFPISVDTYSSPYTRLRMQIKSPTTSNSSSLASIREMSTVSISYPAEYHIFSFDREVYCILNIAPGEYAWLAVGCSSISVTGSGAFLAGSCGSATKTTLEYNNPMFFRSGSTNTSQISSSFFHTGFSYPLEFYPGTSNISLPLGAFGWYESTYGIGTTQPNNFSGESILTPLQIWAQFSASNHCLVFVSDHARYLRIDNYEDEQIITYGADKWMIFPFMKRNSASRSNVNPYHEKSSGTFGWAIRYEGP